MSDDGLQEAALDAALRELAQRWRVEVHYVATRFLQQLSSRGAVGAVAHLLAQPGVFLRVARLAEEDKLDLTVEYLILRRE